MRDDGYDVVDGLDEIERGRRVVRAEHDENELHPVARALVVGTKANVAVERATRRGER